MRTNLLGEAPMTTSPVDRHRRTGRPAPDSDPPILHDPRLAGESPRFVLWMTAARTYREHCVTEGQAVEGRARRGVYESLCDARFRPASMTEPPGPRCHPCAVIYREWLAATQPPPQKPLLRRLTSRLVRPIASGRARSGDPR